MHTDDVDDVKDETAAEAEASEAGIEAPEDADAVVDEAADAEAEEPVVELMPERDPRDERIEQLEQSLQETQARLRAVSKAFTEQKAEMAAFRERIEARAKAREALQGFEAVKAFFDPVQNLQRSLDMGTADPEAFVQGIQMVHKQFQAGLDKLGLERVPGVGAPFDPNIHEALAVMPVPEAAQDGVVLMVHVDGYMVAGKPIQAAQVVIGKYTAPAPAPEEEPASEEQGDSDSDASEDETPQDA